VNSLTDSLHWLDWPAPKTVRACFTTRVGGESIGAFHSFNLAKHVGDIDATVERNRAWLTDALKVQPIWLSQVHGSRVVTADSENLGQEADGAYLSSENGDTGQAAVVMTADCLPVFFCDTEGTQVAVAHAGWRGLAGGVLEATVAKFRATTSGELMAFLGPAIGPNQFEVGADVLEAFTRQSDRFREGFSPQASGKYLADIYHLARLRLSDLGVTQVFGGQWCTYEQDDLFFSYRRDGLTGRMANLIWLTN